MSPNCLICLFCIFVYLFGATVTGKPIIGGNIVKHDNKFPYQVALFFNGMDKGYNCSGGIIGEQYILTAAHCIVEINGNIKTRSLFVLVGTNELRPKTKPSEIIQVQTIFVPEDYEPGFKNTTGDIAILQLVRRLGLWNNKNLKALELPMNLRETYANKTAKIAGWGCDKMRIIKGKEIAAKTEDRLRYARANVLSNEKCQQEYQTMKIGAKKMCARLKQIKFLKTRGTCRGDSGAPLVYNDRTIIGVLSTSPMGCEERLSPAIYTRVSQYYNFIENVKSHRNLARIRTFELIM